MLHAPARVPDENSGRARNPRPKFARRHNESDSTRTNSTEGWQTTLKIRTALQRERFDTPIPTQGWQTTVKICTAPQRQRFDTHDPRRGFAVQLKNSHGATRRAMRRARSPQRVCSDDFRQPYPDFRNKRK